MTKVQAFYETLLPALGFTRNDSNSKWLEFEHDDGDSVSDYLAITESPGHKPNENRIAFWAASDAEVDQLAEVARSAGATNLEGPCFEADFYYAVFFEDPVGNRFEICHRMRN